MAVFRRLGPQTMVLVGGTGYQPPLNESHSEYPKYVHLPKQISVIVNSASEEEAVRSGAALKKQEARLIFDNAPVPTLQGPNNEREMLLTIARSRNIMINERWRTPKIRKAVEKACHTEVSEWP